MSPFSRGRVYETSGDWGSQAVVAAIGGAARARDVRGAEDEVRVCVPIQLIQEDDPGLPDDRLTLPQGELHPVPARFDLQGVRAARGRRDAVAFAGFNVDRLDRPAIHFALTFRAASHGSADRCRGLIG